MQPHQLNSHQLGVPQLHDKLQAEKQDKLIADSSDLLNGANPWSVVKDQLFGSPEAKGRRKQLLSQTLSVAQGVHEATLKGAADNLKLMIDVSEQTRQDELSIKHRHAMDSLSGEAETQMRRSTNALFVNKKQGLREIAQVDGDEELKQIAATYLSELTAASARQLGDRNTKPR